MAETRTSSNTAAASAGAADAAGAAASGNGDEYYTLEELTEFFRFKKGRDSPSEARNVLLVIAVLITTATYQAVLSPPGGFWQETKANETAPNGYVTKGHQAGKTILGTNSFDYGFVVFIAANAAGFFGSLFIIQICTEGFPLQLELWFTILALVASYDFAMISIIPDGKFVNVFVVCSIFLPLVIGFAAKKIRKARMLRSQGHDIC